jgi:hypothetical protein
VDRRRFLVSAVGLAADLALAPAALSSPRSRGPVALVTADREAHVVVLSLPDGRVLRRIPTPSGPRSIETVAGGALVAHSDSGRISLIGSETLSVRHVVGGFRQPRYTASGHDPRRALAYVTDEKLGEVVVVDLARGRIEARVRVPGPARHITLGPRGQRLWTALGFSAEKIAVLGMEDPRRPRLVRTIRPPFLAHDVVFAPDGRHVWVTSGVERRLAIYDSGGRSPVAVLEADAPPQHVAFVGQLAFVASGDGASVRVHRPDGTLVEESRVPEGSYNVTFGAERAVTPSLDRGTVALLDERGRVRAVRTVARAAHDACVLAG